jgi:hypothetical protein
MIPLISCMHLAQWQIQEKPKNNMLVLKMSYVRKVKKHFNLN